MDLTSELNTTKNQMPHQFLKSSFKKNYNVFILFKICFYIFLYHQLLYYVMRLSLLSLSVCRRNDFCALVFVPDVQSF